MHRLQIFVQSKQVCSQHLPMHDTQHSNNESIHKVPLLPSCWWPHKSEQHTYMCVGTNSTRKCCGSKQHSANAG